MSSTLFAVDTRDSSRVVRFNSSVYFMRKWRWCRSGSATHVRISLSRERTSRFREASICFKRLKWIKKRARQPIQTLYSLKRSLSASYVWSSNFHILYDSGWKGKTGSMAVELQSFFVTKTLARKMKYALRGRSQQCRKFLIKLYT